MPIRKRLRDLQRLLAAFIEQPDRGVLLVRCTDEEILYLTHTLEQLDAESPADRFFIAPDPFTDIDNYLDALARRISNELDTPTRPPVTAISEILDHLLAGLPPGDHRLVCALVPARIEDLDRFHDIVEALLVRSPDRLRLVLREDPARPSSASLGPSSQIPVHDLRLPAALVVEATAATATDPSLPPDERAQAILQLAVRETGFGRFERALAAFDLALDLARQTALMALTMAFRADALRMARDLPRAHACACEALRHAVAAKSPPVIHHSALALGEAALGLGRLQDAATSFALAERSAIHPSAAAHARERRAATQVDSHADPRLVSR